MHRWTYRLLVDNVAVPANTSIYHRRYLIIERQAIWGWFNIRCRMDVSLAPPSVIFSIVTSCDDSRMTTGASTGVYSRGRCVLRGWRINPTEHTGRCAQCGGNESPKSEKNVVVCILLFHDIVYILCNIVACCVSLLHTHAHTWSLCHMHISLSNENNIL